MITFLKTRPWLSVVILAAAVCTPLLADRSNISAQTAQKTCSTSGSPAIVKGGVRPGSASQQTSILAFPRSATGDTYLQTLASAAAPAPKSTNLSTAMSAIGAQFQAQANLKVQLPALYASMYGIATDASGNFSCAGLSAGSWTFVGIQQPIAANTPLPSANPKAVFSVPPVGTTPAAGGLVVPSQQQAYAAITTPRRVYYYSSVVIRPKDLQPQPTPAPKKGQTAGPPVYKPVIVPSFQPIASYPAKYFGGGAK